MSNLDKFKEMSKGLDLVQAIAEADRCLLCHDAPCSEGCPADTQPGEFIRKLRFKNVTGAIRTIKENNIMGGACGILCPTSRLCEEKCSAMFKSLNRPEGADRPIEIGRIQRFLVEHSWERGFKIFEKPEPRSEKIAVVGSGPGGLSCAAELAKDGYQVTIFEARPEPGGVLRYGVVSYRFDLDFLKHEMSDVEALGVNFECNTPIDSKNGAEKLLKDGFDAVFLAPGLWDAATIKPDGKDIEGLYSSVDYLAALRDGRFEEIEKKIKGKTVAVIGGGSVAMDCIESAARLDPKDVYLIYRRSYCQMPAEPDERIEAQEAGVHFLLLNQPIDYLTDKKSRLKGLKLARTRLGEPDESGRRKPEPIDGSEWIMDADVVIEAIGNKAPDESPDWYPNVDLDGKKLIKADPETGKTSVDGIFAGGDIVRGPALVVQAVQDGKVAARAIKDYLAK
ncbi:MAG: NAD(P)-dependent oxidoreductase [Desulfobacterales bacterium]|nr:NAD(P)-dependent oxidoreductase [Desulfobacterales bacterium]MDH3828605.1 NAD(P)-dependent oxidoreductase [Desulfobacterales bacterium]MDH3876334.1 NAD(P)-dependent oxidoreductase [Desulfobacterales bacterium]